MNKVFLDSSAFLSFINREHPRHTATIETFELLGHRSYFAYTSLAVVWAVHEAIINTMGSSLAKDFLKIIPQTSIAVVKFTSKDEKQAYQTLHEPLNYNLTLLDALHLSLMQRLSITAAVSTNPLFPQNHITLLGT